MLLTSQWGHAEYNTKYKVGPSWKHETYFAYGIPPLIEYRPWTGFVFNKSISSGEIVYFRDLV